MRRNSDWDNTGLSCRLNRLNKHSRWDKWQDKVSFCSLIRFNWRVPARVPLFSLGLKAPRSGPCGHSGRLSEVVLTHYRRREVRNSIYRYRKIHIDYRSKFSYRFISFISIIYGNTIYMYVYIYIQIHMRMVKQLANLKFQIEPVLYSTMHRSGSEMCTFLFQVVHCGIRDRWIVDLWIWAITCICVHITDVYKLFFFI